MPENLGSTINFQHGELSFVRKGGSVVTRSWAMYSYSEHSGEFETENITFPVLPTTEEAAKITQVLTRSMFPERILVTTLSKGKNFIELFKEKLLPVLLKGRYQIESAEFTMIGPDPVNREKWGPREWGIGTMSLVVRGDTVQDLDKRSPIEPIMRIRRDAVGG